MAVDLCLGEDPCSSLYDKVKMRSHLELCFNQRTISRFRHQFRDRHHRILDEISVYCICRYPDVTTRFGDMICCDLCDEWYHESCLGIPDIELLKESEWLCPRCLVRSNKCYLYFRFCGTNKIVTLFIYVIVELNFFL